MAPRDDWHTLKSGVIDGRLELRDRYRFAVAG